MRNPYKDSIIRTIHKFTNHDAKDSEIIILGYSSESKEEQLYGLYISDSTESSIDGKHITGNLRAYFQRMKEHYGIEVNHISTNQFLKIDYE